MENDHEAQIAYLNEKLESMKILIETEREEYKKFYQNSKNISNINTSNSSNYNFVLPNDHTSYVDIDYYKESELINTLKVQIINLIKHNDMLKSRNRELIEENEMLRGEFKI